MTIQVVNAAGYPPHTDWPEPVRFASMSREAERQQRIRDAYAIERGTRPAHVIASRALYLLAVLILIATAALMWGAT